MAVNCYSGGTVMQYPARSSEIKLANYCCLGQDNDIKHEDKLRNDIRSSYQNYLKIEQENSCLTLQIDNFEDKLNDQNHQYACLKYKLELLNSQNHDLQSEFNRTKAPNNEQFPVVRVSEGETVWSVKSADEKFTIHHANLRKLPEIECECGVEFKTRKNLKEHIKYFSNKGKFRCKICGMGKHKFYLLKHHIKLKHDIEIFP